MSTLITQAIDDKPRIIFFSKASAKKIKTFLSTQEVKISYFDQSQIMDEKIQDLCQKAYRVIFWLDSTDEGYLDVVAKHYGTFSNLQFFIPLITPCFTPAPELASWRIVSQLQAKFLDRLNYLFPQVQCLFFRDTLDLGKHSPVLQVFSQMPQTELLSPDVLLAPTTLPLVMGQAEKFIFNPNRQSLLIQGEETSCLELIKNISLLYGNIYQQDIRVISTQVETSKILPFFVSSVSLFSSTAKLVEDLLKILPSPSRWRPLFALSSEESSVPIENNEVSTANSKKVFEEKPPELAIEKTSDVVADISQLFSRSFRAHRDNLGEKVVQVENKITKKKKKNTWLFFIGLVSMGITLGIIFLASFFWLSVMLTQRSVLAVVPHLFSNQYKQSSRSFWQKKWYSLLNLQTNSYGSLLDISIISRAEKITSLAGLLDDYNNIVPQAHQTKQTLVQQVLGQTDSDISLLAQNATTQSQSAYELLASIQSELSGIMGDSQSEQKIQDELADKLIQLRRGLALERQIIPLLPSLTGYPNKKTLALIFQNSQELRPTGGFLQSMAFITLAQGAVIDVQTVGSSELDGGIGGVVTPPAEIERLLGEKNWFIRDANWDPDFPTTAKTIEWFVNRSRNTQLAGVLAIDTQGLADLIEALGPVDLPEYNEVITHKNIFERLEYHSEAVLVPESGTKDYSVILLDRVLQKLLKTPEDKFPAILQSTRQAAEQQHLLFSFVDDSAQSAFKSLGWSGSILQPPCPPQLAADRCVVEPFYQVEANIGINKANYYLKRKISHNIALAANQAKHTHVVEYKNTAQSNSWPKGDYKAYVRYYLASNSKFEQLLINGQPVSIQDLSFASEHDRILVGATITVPVGSSLTTKLTYTTPLQPSTGSSAYVFFNQKQPGTNAAPLVVTINYPPELQPEKIAPKAELTDTTINFTDKEEKSRMYGAKFF